MSNQLDGKYCAAELEAVENEIEQILTSDGYKKCMTYFPSGINPDNYDNLSDDKQDVAVELMIFEERLDGLKKSEKFWRKLLNRTTDAKVSMSRHKANRKVASLLFSKAFLQSIADKLATFYNFDQIVQKGKRITFGDILFAKNNPDKYCKRIDVSNDIPDDISAFLTEEDWDAIEYWNRCIKTGLRSLSLDQNIVTFTDIKSFAAAFRIANENEILIKYAGSESGGSSASEPS